MKPTRQPDVMDDMQDRRYQRGVLLGLLDIAIKIQGGRISTVEEVHKATRKLCREIEKNP